jgi:hypothetical protein
LEAVTEGNIMSENIFSEFWKSNVIDVVVLVKRTDSVGDSIMLDSQDVLDVYGWTPYDPPERCGNVRDAIIVDRCVINHQKKTYFFHKNPLFQHKLPKDVHGCPLKISIFEYGPMVLRKNTDVKPTSNIYDDGIELHLIHELLKRCNLTPFYRGLPGDGYIWGIHLENGTWTGVINDIITGRSDIAVGNWWYRCHIINEIECLMPHLIDSSRWFVPCAEPYPRWMSLTRVFKLSLWLGFLAAYIIVSFSMWFLVKMSKLTRKIQPDNQSYISIAKCLLNFWAITLEESAPNSPPRNPAIRAVFLCWVLYCYAMNTVYQAFLTTFLVEPGLQHQLSSEDEIFSSGIEYGMPSTLSSVLPGLSDDKYRHRIHCDYFIKCQDRLAYEGNTAFFFSKYNMEYVSFTKYTDRDGKPLVCDFDEIYTHHPVTLMVKKGFVMLKQFDQITLRMREAGLLEHWWNTVKYASTLASAGNFSGPQAEYVKLSLKHLQSAFTFLFFGYALSTITFIVEGLTKCKILINFSICNVLTGEK